MPDTYFAVKLTGDVITWNRVNGNVAFLWKWSKFYL